MLDEMTQQYASKFAIFWEYENPMYSLVKKIKLHEMKNEKKTTWVFVFQKYGKF